MTIPTGTDGEGALRCPSCGVTIATVRPVTRWRGPGVGGIGQEFTIGHRWLLAPGFVNASRRHVNGLPWYVRDLTSPSRPGLELRFGAFVATCSCRTEVEAPPKSPMLMDTGARIRRVRKS